MIVAGMSANVRRMAEMAMVKLVQRDGSTSRLHSNLRDEREMEIPGTYYVYMNSTDSQNVLFCLSSFP